MARGDDIEERLIDFAVEIMGLCAGLPDTVIGRHICGQMLRSGTAPAANYGEARAAESRRDFTHKLRIVLKELNETRIWCELITRRKLSSNPKIPVLIDECNQLCRIIYKSIQTTQNRH